jgi:hypothetical protein
VYASTDCQSGRISAPCRPQAWQVNRGSDLWRPDDTRCEPHLLPARQSAIIKLTHYPNAPKWIARKETRRPIAEKIATGRKPSVKIPVRSSSMAIRMSVGMLCLFGRRKRPQAGESWGRMGQCRTGAERPARF